jgi:hypothetical protein
VMSVARFAGFIWSIDCISATSSVEYLPGVTYVDYTLLISQPAYGSRYEVIFDPQLFELELTALY